MPLPQCRRIGVTPVSEHTKPASPYLGVLAAILLIKLSGRSDTSLQTKAEVRDTDGLTLVRAARDAADGTVYSLVEFDSDRDSTLYVDEITRTMYENPPLNPVGNDSPPDGGACDSTATRFEQRPSRQMTPGEGGSEPTVST